MLVISTNARETATGKHDRISIHLAADAPDISVSNKPQKQGRPRCKTSKLGLLTDRISDG
jgi:hypothetical protein